MGADQNKLLVRRLVEGVNNGSLEVLDKVADAGFARAARQWIGPFRESFRGFGMEITGLIADEEKVAAHFRCPGTHLGRLQRHRPSGRRFCGVDEICVYPGARREAGGRDGDGG